METVITLHSELRLTEAGEVPEWVHLTPAGTFHGRDGRGPYSVDPAAVVAATASQLPLTIDENHSTDLAAPRGEPSPARGWITELQARGDGVWGHVDWTPSGRALVAERSYRGMSPAVATRNGTGPVLKVLRASLTNLPNFTMTTLHHQQETSGMELDRLRTALGLKADATFDECVAAAAQQTQAVSTHAAQLSRIAKAAGAADNADAGAIETVLAAARPAEAEARRMATEIVSLNTQLGQLRETQARKDATAAIDAAIAAGKPITALREHYITRHMAKPEEVERELGAMLSLHAGGLGQRPVPGGDGGAADLSQDEAKVAANMGLTLEQAKANKAKRMATGGRA